MQHIKHYSLGLLVALALLLGALISAQPAMAANGELKGQGTEGEPYQIEDADDLRKYADIINGTGTETVRNPYACAKLMKDIDLNPNYRYDQENNQWTNNDGRVVGEEKLEQWTPIGKAALVSHTFAGTFDGNGKTIYDLYINSSDDYQGLFGYLIALDDSGTVKNLTVSGSITVEGDDVGGIAGYVEGNCMIINCTNMCTVTAKADKAKVGGVVGYNFKGTVTGCTNSGDISAIGTSSNAGGVVGNNNGPGTIENCTNTGNVDGTIAGGVLGENSLGYVISCRSMGNVTGTTVGGVVGNNPLGEVNSCYNKGTVTGITAGGVVGVNAESSTNSAVYRCYNTGIVTGSTTAGGVVGVNAESSTAEISDCYFLKVNGLSGIGETGSTNVKNVEPKTTEEFASGEVAWLLQDAVDEEQGQVWGQDIGTDKYPVLHVFDASALEVYQLTFKQGYEGAEDVLLYTNGTVTLPSNPMRDGYNFEGWNGYSVGMTVTEDTTFIAQWNQITYTVTFNSNGGSTVESQTVAHGGTVKEPDNPTRDGYTFAGWYSDASLDDAWDFDTVISDNITLHAKWLSADTGVSSVTVNDVKAEQNGTTLTVTLPAGSSLPTADEIQITPATGAEVTDDLTTSDNGATWTFTVTAEDGTTTATYTIQVTIAPQPTYTVTVAASSHGSVTANPTSVAAGETVTLTIAPETGYTLAGLNVADANGTAITVNGSDHTYTFTMPDSAVTVTATFRLIEEPVDPTPDPTPTPDPDPSGPSTGESDGWESIADEITAADDGDSITIDMNGETEVPAEIFEDVAGKDVDLVFDMGDGLSWSVNGQDIPTDADLSDLDLGVDLGTDGIPVDVINAITGEKDSVQITLAYDGEFGFTLTLTAPLGEDNAGYWANLYHYDEDTEAMNFEAAAEIGADGSVSLPLSHASQYAIVIDDHSHAATDVSEIFTDVPANHWAKAAIQYVYDNGLMTGVSDSAFAPEATTTRAMIVSMLARMENVTSAADAGFTDVNASDWYATAVNWAAANGIAGGISADTFAPNDPITREQLAAMLMNYAQYKGMDVSARADLSGYSDAPSTWASEAVQWAVAEGLLAGVTDDELQPQGQATRAQVAAIMQRFLEA